MKYLTHALKFQFNFPYKKMSLSTEKTRYIDINPPVLIAAFPCPGPRSIDCSKCYSLNYLSSVHGLCKYEFGLDALSKSLEIPKGWEEKIWERSSIPIVHTVKLFPWIRISPSQHWLQGHSSVKGWQNLKEDVTSMLGSLADTLLRFCCLLLRAGKKQTWNRSRTVSRCI